MSVVRVRRCLCRVVCKLLCLGCLSGVVRSLYVVRGVFRVLCVSCALECRVLCAL